MSERSAITSAKIAAVTGEFRRLCSAMTYLTLEIGDSIRWFDCDTDAYIASNAASIQDIAAIMFGNPIVVVDKMATCRISSTVQPASRAFRT